MDCIYYSLLELALRFGKDDHRQDWTIVVIAASINFYLFSAVEVLRHGAILEIEHPSYPAFFASYVAIAILLYLRYSYNDQWRAGIAAYRKRKKSQLCSHARLFVPIGFITWWIVLLSFRS
jgi:hypothetical protein